LVEGLLELLQRDLQQDGHSGEDGVPIVELVRDEGQGEGGPVVHQGEAVAIEQDAARGGHRSDADAVLLRHLLQAPALQRLQVPELPEQADEPRHGERGQPEDAAAPAVAAVTGPGSYVHPCLRAASAPAITSTQAAPTKPLYSACGHTSCAIRSLRDTGYWKN